jgi:hypothetical protein
MGDSTGPLRHPGPAAGLTIDGRHGPIWLIVIGSRRSQHTLAQHPCWGPRAVDLCIAGDAGGVGGLHRLTRAIDPSCTRIFVRRVAPNVVGAVVGSRRSCWRRGSGADQGRPHRLQQTTCSGRQRGLRRVTGAG